MEALGLVQHITQPTHQLGNTLDHIYTESLDPLGVSFAFISTYISDHRLIGIEINTKKHLEWLDRQPRRPFNQLKLENFKHESNNEQVLEHSNLEGIWTTLKKEITRTLDKLIPPKKKPRKGAKLARTWYNPRLLGQRRIVRNRESKYNKYKEQHQWKAFTRERNRYIRMLNFSKWASIVDLVYQSQNNCKKLFNIANNMLGRKSSNPLPKERTPNELSEDFAAYFLDKIDKIRERFNDIDPYQPSGLDIPQLVKFTPVTSSKLGGIIKKVPRPAN